MKTIWFVNWEDLSSAWSSKSKALNYLHGEAERIGATMTIVEEWEYSFYVSMRYEDGEVIYIDCCQYEVDELPYILPEQGEE